MVFEYHLSVRGYELDSYDHVNNAVYLNYMEQARWEMLAETGLLATLQSKQMLMVVTEINIRYSKEAKLFDKLLVKSTAMVSEPYVIFEQFIYNETTGEKLTKAVVKLVCIDGDRIATNIPDGFYSIFGHASAAEKTDNS